MPSLLQKEKGRASRETAFWTQEPCTLENSYFKIIQLFAKTRLRHLVNAAFCLPGWGLGVGGKTLCDLRACLVIHLKKCEVKSRALFLVLMILLFLFTLIARSERQAPWSLKAK